MKLQKCQVRECGSLVMVVQIAGKPYALNPVRVELALPAEDGSFRLVQGFQPHHATCVDIARRRDQTAVAAP